ncbi:MAG: 16S rRNA processing protein RimM, partial [Caulobacterales bacterium RIFOXYA1_FULL_67_7]
MTTDSRLILVGQIGGGFGVRGEVRVTAFTADPLALTAYGPLLRADGTVALTLSATRPDKSGVVGRAKEIATKEQADALRGLKLYVPRDRFPEPDEDEFYLADLLGVEVRDTAGEVMGTVKSVQNFGADDMLEIAPATGGPTWYL